MRAHEVVALIIKERDEMERKAVDALSRYKFWMFGYYAAKWVSYNRLIGDGKANPFRQLVKTAQWMKHEQEKQSSGSE